VNSSTETEHRTELDAGDVVAIRRNVWLSGVVAGLAALIGLVYLGRGSTAIDTAVGIVLLLIAVLHGTAVRSSHVPVLVADEHGIRMRIGLSWRGLPWGSVRQLVVEHADNPLREGRLVVTPRDPNSALDYLDLLGRLHLRWNELWYGAPLSVPLGMTTLSDSRDLGSDLGALADGRTDVVHLRGRQLAQLEDVVAPARVEEAPPEDAALEDAALEDARPEEAAADQRDPVLDRMAEIIVPATDAPPAEDWLEEDWRRDEPAESGPAEDEPVEDAWSLDEATAADTAEQPIVALVPDEPDEPDEPAVDEAPEELPEPVLPVRALHRPARVEVRLDTPAMSGHDVADANDVPTIHAAPAGVVPAQRISDDDVIVPDLEHAEAWEEVPVEIEADDLAVHLPSEPVIGPSIVHAREMLDMGIEELSERTRIRPHVIEAIEVDDFGPCGGDFYARGHLTAIARVLGLTIEPLMQEYDARYAGGPINARRVFEAELATGLSSGMRATRGGPRWTMLIGSVLCLTIVWGAARLVSGEPDELALPPVASGDSAGLAANHEPITSDLMKTTPMTVTAAHAGAHVAVRDRTGRMLWSGDLRMTQHRKIVGLAPFRVVTDNAGAIEVTVDGDSRGTVGTPGEAGAKRFAQ
jgi:cytoskeleton protein RodZ